MQRQISHSTQTEDNYTSSEEDTITHTRVPVSKNKHAIPELLVDDLRSKARKIPGEKRSKSGHPVLPRKKKGIPPKSNPVVREQASLRLRISNLQQQV